ncbi:MAG: zinc metalloprotease, partial [Cytophagaceae bacterium]
MTKLYSVLVSGVLAALALGARPAAGQTQPAPIRRCATEEVNSQIQAELQRLMPGYNAARSTKDGRATALRTQATTYTLPIIVHVIHNGEAVGTGVNLSRAQVQSQIDVLNEDYRNLNADGTSTAVVPAAFQALRGDVQLQFVPAQRDPSGNMLAEPGIDRVNRTTKGFTFPAAGYSTTYINSTIKPGTYWNPEQYINIWVLPLGSNLLGYAQFPDNTANVGGLSALGGSATTDGVVILYTAFGSQLKNPTGIYGTNNPYNRGRTLTHELGHFFGMRHIWGDDDCGNDYVDDTPAQYEENYNCPSFPHVTCSNGPGGDMFMNYMDYVNDACMAMFSKAQANRVQAIMAAGTPRRTNLLSSPAICTNLVAATIGAPTYTACSGSNVTLAAAGPTGATYYWTGPNDYTSTAQNPTLTNTTAFMAGTYAVAVSVGSGACPVRLTTNLVV